MMKGEKKAYPLTHRNFQLGKTLLVRFCLTYILDNIDIILSNCPCIFDTCFIF